MATFDRGVHIRPSIDSVMRQTFRDFELIVVEDGSAGNSEAISPSFPRDQLRWLALPEHSGSQSAPNNLGFYEGRGSWIAYIGHDDLWARDHLQRIRDLIDSPEPPDIAVSGCVYHGPPGCGVICVTGLFDLEDAPFAEFFPPSSIAMRRDILRRIGGWRDPRLIAPPVDADVLLRAAYSGASFRSTDTITVHKFAAGHRYLSYLQPSCDEQRAMLESGTPDDHAARAEVIAEARRHGRTAMLYPDFTQAEAGANYVSNRSNKGLEKPPLRPLLQRTVLRQTQETRALDWHGLEGEAGPFRWSGPNPRPKILIPYTCETNVCISLQVIHSFTELGDVEIAVNGRLLATEVWQDANGSRLRINTALERSGYTVLELHTPNMVRPSDRSASTDDRLLGIAIGDVWLEPTQS